MLATGDADNNVKLWDADKGTIKNTLFANEDPVSCVVFSPDGSKVASGSIDRTVRLWDSRSGRLLVTFMILPPAIKDTPSLDWIAFTPQGYYTGSSGAPKFIRWRVGNEYFSANTYEHLFHRPDLVLKSLQGNN
jgi:WD40 repeat protein